VKKVRWLSLSEYALVLGTGAGVIASAATQQLLYATAPLWLLVALGLVNRRQLEARTQAEKQQFSRFSVSAFHQLQKLQAQVSALPTPESLTSFQRSIMAHNDRAIVRFSREFTQARQDLDTRLQAFEAPDLSPIHQDVAQLQDQYTYLCTAMDQLTRQMQQIVHLPRVEATEASLAQLRTEMMQMRVNLELLGNDTKSTLATLQDNVSHFDRRLRQTPAQGETHLLREEVAELIKAVTDLVPRREFNGLLGQIRELREQQAALRQATETVGLTTAQPRAIDTATTAALEQLRSEFNDLTAQLHHLQTQPRPEIDVREAVTDYLQDLQKQLTRLRSFTHALAWQQQEVGKQIRQFPQLLDSATLEQQVQTLTARLGLAEDGVADVRQQVATQLRSGQRAPTGSNSGQLIWDWPGEEETTPGFQGSRAALEQAIQVAQQRLVLVWPWADGVALDSDLVAQLQRLLRRQCRVDFGWCHGGEGRQVGWLRPVSQRWGQESQQKRQLRQALNQLLPLKQAFPELFHFQVLGTLENFLVCDRTYAIVGLQPLQTQSSQLSQVGLKLRIDEPTVIESLVRQFDHPLIDPQNAVAYLNRGLTRYDLGDYSGAVDDLTQVLQTRPQAASVYAYRGLARAELGQTDSALRDFSHGIRQDPQLTVAYGNRGILYLELGDYRRACEDFTTVIAQMPQSAIAYFYRGTLLQKQGDLTAAIADFSQAIQLAPHHPLPYCYRGALYQKRGQTPADRQQAITDLETATRYLSEQGDTKTLAAVVKTLNQLRGTSPTQRTVRSPVASC
jgi:Flp pilus assembly protein TadD